ncbi:MAG TPA: hypothetical protein EYH56_00720 [Nanoarchaeota archaeon]|nr:hypothetical protein [Nanoarchaeota archaeon]
MPSLCLRCKGGKFLCGRNYCPLNVVRFAEKSVKRILKNQVYSPTPPSVFVGRIGYPYVYAGPLVSLLENQNLEILDNPSQWYGKDYKEIINFRAYLLRIKKTINVKQPEKFHENIKELVLSEKPVYVEAYFKKLVPKISFSSFLQPMGPSGEIKKLIIASTPKIPQKTEKIISDDIKASEQVYMLYKSGEDVYSITRLFSTGILGKQKKLVPTRWSITAVDDIIAKKLLQKIRGYSLINEYLVWNNEHLGNHFEILFIPKPWSFELFEAWSAGSVWAGKELKITVEREIWRDRTCYAIEQGGGYYAARLAICEQLEKMRKQACVVVFREIYESYVLPVGVWEVRETIRRAFEQKPEKFSDLKQALATIEKRLKVPLKYYLKLSMVLTQKTLNNF